MSYVVAFSDSLTKINRVNMSNNFTEYDSLEATA